MLTVDFDRLDLQPGMRVLDLGCGAGRHAFAALRRGARVVALDRDAREVATTGEWLAAMTASGETPAGASGVAVRGDLLALPFPDAAFDRVIAAEVLEHVPDDAAALAEVERVLRPGGMLAVTVPRWLPERLCWALSHDYHAKDGGHVRIYRGTELTAKLGAAGFRSLGGHHAHALHAPYWWLKCAVGPERDHPLTRLYHRLLVWDITAQPFLTRGAERLLNPVIGKSLVVYARKPGALTPPATEAARAIA